MEKKFNELSKKIDDIDEKIETYNQTIPKQINEIVENKLKIGVFNVVKWLSITAGGVIVVSIVTKALTGM
jgi:tetrahydromethanopterin S-methyltransferase subunit G